MGWLDAVGGLVKGAAQDAWNGASNVASGAEHLADDGYKLATDSHYREQAWHSVINEAKAAAGFAQKAVVGADAAKEQLGSWIDSGEKYLENKVDDGRAWLRQNGGVAGQAASALIGFDEGVGVSLYDAGKGLVQLADGAQSLANPIEWLANPSANIARVKSTINTVETVGRIANLANSASWMTDPQGNARLAGALWHSAATNFQNDPAKFTGNLVATVGTLFIPGADVAGVAADTAKTAELATDVSKAATITNDASKAAAITGDASKAAAVTQDAGKAAAVTGDASKGTAITGDAGKAVEEFPEGLAYRKDLPDHLAGPDGFTKSGQLKGTHNLDNATKALDAKGATYSLDPTGTPGISELKYKYFDPALGKTVSGRKTVYDPKIISDKTMLDGAMKAGQQGWEKYLQNPANRVFDISEGGVNFRVYINTDSRGNAFVGNVHPIS